jgi:hypothetical protein
MGFPEAVSLRDPNRSPTLSYFQINRNTFMELRAVTAAGPAGFVHFGLEVRNVDEVVKLLRSAGVNVGDPGTIPQTKSPIAVAGTPQGDKSGVAGMDRNPSSGRSWMPGSRSDCHRAGHVPNGSQPPDDRA